MAYFKGDKDKNTIIGGAEPDTIDGGAGDDRMLGGRGDDTYMVDDSGDEVIEAASEGTDTIRTSLDNYTLPVNVENLILTGTSAINGTGNALANTITGNSGNNTINGGAGADTMAGGAGNDIYIVDNNGDTVIEEASEGTDTVQSSVNYRLPENFENLYLTGTSAINGTGNALDNTILGNSNKNTINGGNGDDTIYGYEGADTINGGDGDDTIYGGTGADEMIGGEGNDYYVVDNNSDVVTEEASEGIDTVESSLGFTLAANFENLFLTGSTAINGTGNALDNIITGNSGGNTLNGAGGNDIIDGGAGGDTIYGGYGDDTIDGGRGADNMVGGDGNDIYVVDDDSDVITEKVSEGTDTVRSSISYILGNYVENLVLTNLDQGPIDAPNVDGFSPAPPNINGTGNSLNNTITGNSGNNIINGGTGADTMAGGLGDDTYVVDNSGDIVTEAASEGTDTVESSVSFALAENIENLILTGTSDINGTANALKNNITGNSGDNTIDGGAGEDIMAGGLGDDIYIVDHVGDTITEAESAGTDTARSSVSYALTANVENLILTGTSAINGTGNALANTITGNAGTNILAGRAGDDYYIIGEGDSVVEGSDGGTDTVESSVSFTLAQNVENLILAAGTSAINGIGNDLANTITGNSGNNTLNGGDGADTINGGDGADNITGGDGADTINGGTGADVITGGDGADTINGDDGADTITGGDGADTINGGTGADVMRGGRGDDTYVVDNSGDTVTEIAFISDGIDTVRSSVSFSLAADVENLILTGSTAINGTGNSLNNTITGNSGNNIINGGTGADTMAGGLGDDTYLVNDADDVVTEAIGEGTDSIQSSVTYTIAANIENLILTGTSAINGTGNALNNTINGNSGNNTIDGGAGEDIMAGGLGDDTYVVDNANDVVTEAIGEGTDSIRSSVTYTIAANIENLILTGTSAINGTGNALNNTINGNSGNNTIDGGAGEDIMAGGAGSDIYVVDNLNDVVTEVASEGTDSVRSSINHTIAANIENLILTGSTGINGTGNDLANTITGNSGDNTLDGGTGADTMVGGAGSDIYVVDNIGDTVTETISAGTDTVRSSVSFALSEYVENLILTGSTAINGTGNSLNNTITGNSGNNIINGGTGADTMAGGLGDDTYVVDNSGDIVTEAASEGTDTVESSVSFILAENVDNLNLAGTSGINGTGNASNNVLRGNSAANILIGGAGADVLTGLGGADTFRTALADSRLESLDRITDFAIGTDILDGPTAVNTTNTKELGAVRTLDQAGISALLTTAVFGTNQAATFTFGTGTGARTFLALNDMNAGFSSTSDALIEITGYTGLLTNLAIA